MIDYHFFAPDFCFQRKLKELLFTTKNSAIKRTKELFCVKVLKPTKNNLNQLEHIFLT